METLQSLNRERGVTIIVVTHEPDIATYTDRVITMRDGEVISDERKPAVRPQPEASSGVLPRPFACPPQPAPAPQAPARARCGLSPLMIVAAALQALARNKMRSALTMLGVFIGVAALIAMVAVGQGANEAVRKQIESLGTNLLVVVPGATTMGGMRSGQGSASPSRSWMPRRSAAKLRRSAASAISSARRDRSNTPTRTGRRTFRVSAPTIRRSPIGRSRRAAAFRRRMTQRGTRRGAGPDRVPPIFGAEENPIGAVIQVKSVPLRVIGVLRVQGTDSLTGPDQDDLVMIPFTTAERKVLGVAAPSQQQVRSIGSIRRRPIPTIFSRG